MSVYQIGSFSFNRNGTDYTVNMFVETSNGVVTATGFTSGLVTQTERGMPANTEFNAKLLDGGDLATFYSQFTYPYAYAQIGPPPEPQPDQCDLTISAQSTNETSQGADDGTITVSATSSFSNVQVSINGVDWFASPNTFTGLAPAEYTAQSKDSNGCARSLLVAVEEFANPITSRPEVMVLPGKISRWNAAFNPVVFTFQNTPDTNKKNYRIEIEITSQSGVVIGQWSPNTSGFTRADISAYLQGLVNAKDNFKYDVINWRDMDRSASFTIRYRGVWDGDATIWYNGPQPYYVTWSAMQLGDKYGGNMAEYVPMISGGAISPASFDFYLLEFEGEDTNLQIKANGVEVLNVYTSEEGQINLPDGSAISIEAYSQTGGSFPGDFLFLQVKKDSIIVFSKTISFAPGASILYNLTAQSGSVYEVVVQSSVFPQQDINIPDSYTPPVTSTFAAKWLTLFKEPTYNIGYPFDLSFIFSEYIIGSGVKMRTISLDINRHPIAGGTVNSFILNNDAGYILNTDTSRLIIQQGALPPVSNDGILEALGINRLMMAGNPSIGVEYFQVQLYTGTDEAPNFITQPIVVKVNMPCNDPFIYLKWLNTLGGWDYFRFGHDQILSLNTSEGISVDRNVFDWANDETIADTITKNAVRRISFGATVSDKKLDGLLGLHKSTHIMLQVGFNPIKFHTVTLGVGGFDIKRTKANTAELKFQISLPETNIQRQ